MSHHRITRRDTLCMLGALPVLAMFSRVGFAAAAPLKIALIGAGRMGSDIGTLFVKAGHDVMFATRHPEELKALVDGLGTHAHAGTVDEAITFGDVVVLTIPYTGIPDLARDYGKRLAAKRLVIDVGNPSARRDGDAGAAAIDKGAGPYLVGLMPGLKVIRAFNAINYLKLPEYATRTGAAKVAVPFVGDDKGAVALAETLIREIGFEPVLIGGLDKSKYTLPGQPLADAHTPEEARKIIAELK